MKKSLIVQRLEGTEYDLEELGIRVIQFEPPSANFVQNLVSVGKYGQRVAGTTVEQRQIPFQCDVFASSDSSIVVKRQQFFQIFDSFEQFYVIDKRIPTIRWKVVAEQQPFGFYENYHMGGDISFNLDCVDGFAESIDTTLNIDNMNKWSIEGMNLPLDKPIKYQFDIKKFSVYNASSIDILADERPFNIVFKGSADKLTIKNVTTNQEFKSNIAITKLDQFVLHGLWPTINDHSIYADTNHGYIDLKKGWNDFEVSGVDKGFQIGIDTRFYY